MMFFLFFLVIFSNCLTIPVVREKSKVKLALAIPTGAPTIVVNEIIDTPPIVHLKQLKHDQYNQKQQLIYLIFYCIFS